MLQSLYQFLVESLGTQAGLTVVSGAAIIMIVGFFIIVALFVAVNNLNSANKKLRKDKEILLSQSDDMIEETDSLIQIEKEKAKTLLSQLDEKDAQIQSLQSSSKLTECSLQDLKALEEQQKLKLEEKDKIIEQEKYNLKLEQESHSSTKLDLKTTAFVRDELEADVNRASYLVGKLLRAFMLHTKKTKNTVQYYAYTFCNVALKDGTSKVLALHIPYEKLVNAVKKINPDQPISESVDTVQNGQGYALNLYGIRKEVFAELGWSENSHSFLMELSNIGIDISDVDRVIPEPAFYFASAVHNRSLETKLVLTSQGRTRNEHLVDEFYNQVIPYIQSNTRSSENILAFHGDIALYLKYLDFDASELRNVEELIKFSNVRVNV